MQVKIVQCWIGLLAMWFVSLSQAFAVNVTLSWTPSTSPDAVGYNIYYGTACGNYTVKIAAGNTTTLTISNLVCGETYYFAATTVDVYGTESGYSTEAEFIVPGVLVMCARGNANSPGVMEFPEAPAQWYEVQASTDLANWTTIWQTAVAATNDWVQFTDPDAGAYASRFYRLVMH